MVTPGLALVLTLKNGEPLCLSPGIRHGQSGRHSDPHKRHRTFTFWCLGTVFHLLQFIQASLDSIAMMEKFFRVSKIHREQRQGLCYFADHHHIARERVVLSILPSSFMSSTKMALCTSLDSRLLLDQGKVKETLDRAEKVLLFTFQQTAAKALVKPRSS